MLSPQREASPGVIHVSSRMFIMYRGLGRGQDLDQCCPGKLFFNLKPEKGVCVDQRREWSPSDNLCSVFRHLSFQLQVLEELELDKA